MAEGKLIIEVYEYLEDSTSIPPFAYIPCKLSKCMGWKRHATLKEIIQQGFNSSPSRQQNKEKRTDVFRMLEEANIGRINVAYKPARSGVDACVELTNVVPVSIMGGDATRRKSGSQNDIILYGRYRMTDGNESTILKDAQRLTLIYTSRPDQFDHEAGENDLFDVQKEICLNITYLNEE